MALKDLPSHVVLWIVGTGACESELKELVVRERLSDRVKFFGICMDVQRFMQSADLLLCPSTWGEAAGLVLLEAQACGLPLVASRIGGIPEYVEECSALLFEPGEMSEFMNQIRRVVSDMDLQKRISLDARAVALRRFAPAVRLPVILDFYRKE
jgi:glycosyltransferase involved in cell wall biosynthesis